jgi:hypothetical protein
LKHSLGAIQRVLIIPEADLHCVQLTMIQLTISTPYSPILQALIP